MTVWQTIRVHISNWRPGWSCVSEDLLVLFYLQNCYCLWSRMSGVLARRRIRRTSVRCSAACSAPSRGALWPRSAASAGRPAICPAERQKHTESANTGVCWWNPRAQSDSSTSQWLGKEDAHDQLDVCTDTSLERRFTNHSKHTSASSYLDLFRFAGRDVETHTLRETDTGHIRNEDRDPRLSADLVTDRLPWYMKTQHSQILILLII